ncbi:MAG: hypothetical protein ACXVCY_19570, partial [Pseudobdellovibrionaceae bacterium]
MLISRCLSVIVFALFFCLKLNFAEAKEFPVQARFFAGVNSVKPDTLNPVLQTDGLKKMDALGRYGFEANYPVLN